MTRHTRRQKRMSEAIGPHKSRNQALDVLRGIAILLVMGFHDDYFRILGRGGWIGVDLFFVLSGFLISGLLFSEYQRFGRIDVVRFLIRRGFKIYPAFYVFMGITAIHWELFHGYVPRRILSDLFFVQDYFPHIWPHGWTLAVEEQFYLLLPLLLLVMIARSGNKKNPFGGIPWTFVILSVGCLTLRTVAVLRGAPLHEIQFPAQNRFDSLFAGVALGYYRHFHPGLFRRAARKPLWAPGLAVLTPAFVLANSDSFMNTIGVTMLYVGFGCLLVWAVDRQPSRNPGARALAWTGRFSYSIYLWHFALKDALFSGPPDLASFLLFLAVSIAFGAAMSRLVEIPALRLRDRFFPARTPLPPDVAGAEASGAPRQSLAAG